MATIEELLAEPPRLWVGLSGETITGQEVATFLGEVESLLHEEGWLRHRQWDADDDDLADPGEGASVRQMVRALIDFFRSERKRTPGYTLTEARNEVLRRSGDSDVQYVAHRLMKLVLSHQVNAPLADEDAWSRRPERTADEVLDLVATAAKLATKYGPAGAVAA